MSDGQVIFRDLAKVGCESCGAAFHRSPIAGDELGALFQTGYALPALSPKADAQRAKLYGDWILGLVGRQPITSILEIGCGSGSLIHHLAAALRTERSVGFDPAMPSGRGTHADRLWLFRGSIECLDDRETFDLAICVNVIEHVSDPIQLLQRIASHVEQDGTLAIICPSDKPNPELLFLDHVTTFGDRAMRRVARAAGCHVAGTYTAPEHIGDFHLFLMKRGTEGLPAAELHSSHAANERARYLGAWRDLDQFLVRRLERTDEVAVFGATEAASLLRAYAPQFWRRVTFLTVDDCSEAWPLDRPVVPYRDLVPSGDRTFVVGVRPGRQSPVAERLARDHHRSLIWDDYIASHPSAEFGEANAAGLPDRG